MSGQPGEAQVRLGDQLGSGEPHGHRAREQKNGVTVSRAGTLVPGTFICGEAWFSTKKDVYVTNTSSICGVTASVSHWLLAIKFWDARLQGPPRPVQQLRGPLQMEGSTALKQQGLSRPQSTLVVRGTVRAWCDARVARSAGSAYKSPAEEPLPLTRFAPLDCATRRAVRRSRRAASFSRFVGFDPIEVGQDLVATKAEKRLVPPGEGPVVATLLRVEGAPCGMVDPVGRRAIASPAPGRQRRDAVVQGDVEDRPLRAEVNINLSVVTNREADLHQLHNDQIWHFPAPNSLTTPEMPIDGIGARVRADLLAGQAQNACQIRERYDMLHSHQGGGHARHTGRDRSGPRP